jgi:hypothetical protein
VDGAGPPHAHRYEQERAFFGFIVSGLACLEAAAYSVYTLAAAADPRGFPFVTPEDRRRVTMGLTRDKLMRNHSRRRITAALTQLTSTSWYLDRVQIRNVLVHRGLPGGIIGVGGPSSYHPFEDVSDVAVSRATTDQGRAQLAGAATRIVNGLLAFARHAARL